MDRSRTQLEPPEEFPFPFTPYSIQEDLMRNLYTTLEEKKLGIFESPTGTGKSMSLICGSLKWLLDAENRRKNDLNKEIKELDHKLSDVSLSANWLDEHAHQAKIRQKRDDLRHQLTKIMQKEEKVESIRNKAKKLSDKSISSNKYKQKKLEANNKENKLDNEEKQLNHDDLADENILLEEESDMKASEPSSDSEHEHERNEEDTYSGIKIFLCSRTHSQLAQLVREIQKSPYKDVNIRVISLASRLNYCINESVLQLKSLTLINERCQDLHNRKKTKKTVTGTEGKVVKKQKLQNKTSGCPFYQQTNIDNLKAKALSEIEDIEQMVQSGKSLSGCPYFASRRAVEDAQVVVVPYNTILHRSTRLACNINLSDSIVIIDEAHNLLDTIGNIHSCFVTGHQLACSHSQLVQYKEKYHGLFNSYNLLHLNQLIFVINKLLQRIGGKVGMHPNSAAPNVNQVVLHTLAEFILACEIDTINLYKVLEFTNKSKVIHKLRGFSEKYRPSVVIYKKKEEKGVSAFLKSMTSKKSAVVEAQESVIVEEDHIEGNPLLPVLSFIEALTNHCLDGRVVASQGTTVGNSSLKFLLLNPAAHFSDIVKEARSVVLAGGTMQPISEFTDQLFHLAGGTPDRISTFSCGHVIPPSNILPIILESGPTSKLLDFSYQNRKEEGLLDELGRILVNVCNIIPAGVVCFFPSYEYESFVFQHFQKTNVIQKLQNKKKVMREPKKSNEVDLVLREYSKAVEKSGALLFSVVGGKLSEGLNFSDDLGRGVVVVGLPYPNSTSPELKEKMNYLNATVGPGAGKIYYENLCMKAVNQSIGRSVRHKDDFATVLLIDHRYSRANCKNSLPEWIQKSLRVEQNFGPVIGQLARFFASKKSNVKR